MEKSINKWKENVTASERSEMQSLIVLKAHQFKDHRYERFQNPM